MPPYREISIFDPQFVRLSRFDIRFACLSKYNPEHMNSFNLRDSSLFLSFSLLMAWQRTVLPFPGKEENASLPALFARTRSRTSAAQTRGRDWRRRNQPPSGSGHSGAGPPATSSPHPPPDQLAGGPHSPRTQSARAEASWGVHRVWPINERLPLDRTPRRSPPHCSWSSSIAAGPVVLLSMPASRSSESAVAAAAAMEASEGTGDGSRKMATRGVDASSESSASLAQRR